MTNEYPKAKKQNLYLSSQLCWNIEHITRLFLRRCADAMRVPGVFKEFFKTGSNKNEVGLCHENLSCTRKIF